MQARRQCDDILKSMKGKKKIYIQQNYSPGIKDNFYIPLHTYYDGYDLFQNTENNKCWYGKTRTFVRDW